MAETEQNGAKPASEMNPSGAPEQVVDDVDVSHPAVDNDPRADTTAMQNRIDFNDPTLSGAEASAKALNAQGVPTKAGTPAAKKGK